MILLGEAAPTYTPSMGSTVKMPLSVDVIVPYLPDGGLRDKNFHYLMSLWQEYHPTLNIHAGTPPGQEWNKAKAIEDALSKSSAKTLIVADADVWCTPQQLISAVSVVDARGGWAMPHQRVYRLDAATSAQWTPEYKGKIRCERAPYVGVPGGGMFVIRRVDYERAPMDPRFRGHSGQDIAYAHAADTLVAPHRRLWGKLWHLHHPPQEPRVTRSTLDPTSASWVSMPVPATCEPGCANL